MPEQTGPEMLTITLTGRRPVRVNKSEWRVVAKADAALGEPYANDYQLARLYVRQHEDGRGIVYGVLTWQGPDIRRGHLVASPEEIPDTVHAVADEMADGDPRDPNAQHPWERPWPSRAAWHRMAEQAIADLPAEVL